MAKAFYPPQPSAFWRQVFIMLLPWLLRRLGGGIQLHWSEGVKKRLPELREKRLLLLPNHPTGEDPVILFALSVLAKQPFYFVCAREAFALDGGLRGWLFQRLGVYSIIRGASDRQSFKMSRQILAEGRAPLVIFVEGEITQNNDSLISLEPGVLQLAFLAQEEALRRQQHGRVNQDKPNVRVLPVAIRYEYLPGAEAKLLQAIERLEAEAGLDSAQAAGKAAADRLIALSLHVLRVHEDWLQLKPQPETSVQERLEAVRHTMLEKMEIYLDLPVDARAPALDRVRHIRNAMDRAVHAYDEPEGLSPYAEAFFSEHQSRRFAEFYRDLDRVVNFLTLKEGYLSEHSTLQRQIEVLLRLEKEMLGAAHFKHPRRAYVTLGEGIALAEHYTAYKEHRKATIADLMRRIEQQLRAGLTPCV